MESPQTLTTDLRLSLNSWTCSTSTETGGCSADQENAPQDRQPAGSKRLVSVQWSRKTDKELDMSQICLMNIWIHQFPSAGRFNSKLTLDFLNFWMNIFSTAVNALISPRSITLSQIIAFLRVCSCHLADKWLHQASISFILTQCKRNVTNCLFHLPGFFSANRLSIRSKKIQTTVNVCHNSLKPEEYCQSLVLSKIQRHSSYYQVKQRDKTNSHNCGAKPRNVSHFCKRNLNNQSIWQVSPDLKHFPSEIFVWRQC